MSKALQFVKKSYPYFLGGRSVQSNRKVLDVTDKYSGKVVSQVECASADVVKEAFRQARASEAKMRELPSYKRKEILLNVAEKLKQREEELANIITVEVGKPIRDSRAEVGRAVDTFTVSAEEAVRQAGEYNKYDISSRNDGFQGIVSRYPVGTVSMVVPFNFPLNLAAHKVGPAIAAGCPFVMKPSDRTPISALVLAEILSEAGLPEGAFSVLPCENQDAHVFSTDPNIMIPYYNTHGAPIKQVLIKTEALSFTGSAAVGWKLKQAAGKAKVLLELGGNAAVIVDETADVERAAQRLLWGAFYSQGQSCISVQRIYLHESVYDAIAQKLKAGAASLKMGDPADPETFIGPMITENDAIRLEKWVGEATKHGAKVLVGGKREGNFFTPTVLEDVHNGADIHCQEAFGPVAVLIKFTDFKEAVKMVNDGDYGLQTGLFTKDLNRVFYAFDNLEVGGVVVNDVSAARVDSMPYGGIKDSGFGREGVKYAIQELTEPKILLLKDIGKL